MCIQKPFNASSSKQKLAAKAKKTERQGKMKTAKVNFS